MTTVSLLHGVANGTSDFDWDGLPPPGIHEKTIDDVHVLQIRPSSQDTSFLFEDTKLDKGWLSLNCKVTCELTGKSSDKPSPPPPPPPPEGSFANPATSKHAYGAAKPAVHSGLQVKFTETECAASISLGYMDGEAVLITSLRRPGDAVADTAYHYSLASTKDRRIVSKSSANFVLVRETSGRHSFVSTHHQNKDGSTTTGVIAQNLNKDITSADENAVYKDVEFVEAALGLSLTDTGMVVFLCDGRAVRSAGGFGGVGSKGGEVAGGGGGGGGGGGLVKSSGGQMGQPLTSQQPTMFRVKQSEAGTFVLNANQRNMTTAAPEAAAAAAGPASAMVGVFVANGTEEENCEASFADYDVRSGK
jgi:hypothetical protein